MGRTHRQESWHVVNEFMYNSTCCGRGLVSVFTGFVKLVAQHRIEKDTERIVRVTGRG